MLDSLRTELTRLDHELESGKALEADVLEALNARQQESALQAALVREYGLRLKSVEDSLRTLESTIPGLESQLGDVEIQLDSLERLRRPVQESLGHVLIAQRRLTQWTVLDFLLGAGSWRDLLKRRNVVDRMRNSGLAYTRKLTAQVQVLENSSSALLTRTAELRRARLEFAHLREVYGNTERTLRQEESALRKSKASLQLQLDRIRNNRRILQLSREQNTRALDAIEDMIASIASGTAISGTPLNLLKGKLPWPADGRLVEKFGQTKNERLATVTDNPGIDLECGAETPVHAIAPGKVSSVTWLRGFGNVCIVEHPGSYFTVYARLGQISVDADAVVSDTTLLGYPSFDPLNETYRLHFEIWDRREKQDPLRWLSRK